MDNKEKIKALVNEGVEAIKVSILYNYINSEDTNKEVYLGDEFRRYMADAVIELRNKGNERESAIGRDANITRNMRYPPSERRMASDRVERNKKKAHEISKAIRLANKLSGGDNYTIEVNTNKLSKKDSKRLPLVVEISSTKNDLSIVSVGLKSVIDLIARTGGFSIIENNLEADVKFPYTLGRGLATIALLLGMNKFVTVPNKYINICERYVSEVLTDIEIKKSYIQSSAINLLSSIFAEHVPSVVADLKAGGSNSQKEKIGKTIRLLSPESDNSTIETLVSALTEIHSSFYKDVDNSFEIVHGDSIPYFYNSFNNTYIEKLPNGESREGIGNEDLLVDDEDYDIKGGVLASSCMRYNNNYRELSFYANNPDKIGMLILRGIEKNKIMGRAIVWYPGDGNTYVDRIYSISERIENLFRSYIKKNNMIGIHVSSSIEGSKNRHKFTIDGLNPPIGNVTDLPFLDSLSKVCTYVTKEGHFYRMLGYRVDTKSSIEDLLEEKAKDNDVKVIEQRTLTRITRDTIKDKLLRKDESIEDYIKPDYSSNARDEINIAQKVLNIKQPQKFIREQYLVSMKGCISPKSISTMATPFENFDISKIFIYHIPSLINNRRVMSKLLIDDHVDFVHSRHTKGIGITVSTDNVYRIFGKKNVKRIGPNRFEYLPGKEKYMNKVKKNNRPQDKYRDMRNYFNPSQTQMIHMKY